MLAKLALALAFSLPLAFAADAPPPPPGETAELRTLLQRGLFEEEASRDFGKAAAAYGALLSQYDSQRVLAATALFHLAEIRRGEGKAAEAIALHQRLLTQYGGVEALAAASRDRLASLGQAPPVPAEEIAKSPASGEEAAELARLREIAKASPDLLAPAADPKSPLNLAAERGWIRVAAFLLEQGVAADGPDGAGAPLVAASNAGHKKLVELLLDRGAKTAPKDAAGLPAEDTALGAACAAGRIAVAKLLLDRGADPNAADASGRTPLYRAANVTQARVLLPLLLEKGARPNAAGKDPYYHYAEGAPKPAHPTAYSTPATPLSILAQRGEPTLVKLLLDHGADPNFAFGKTEAGALARTIILARKYADGEPQYLGNDLAPTNFEDLLVATVKLLLDAGAKADLVLDSSENAVIFDGSLLHISCAGDFRIATLLVQHGAPVDLPDPFGYTPLHRAIRDFEQPSALQRAARENSSGGSGDRQFGPSTGGRARATTDRKSDTGGNRAPGPLRISVSNQYWHQALPPVTAEALRTFCELLLAKGAKADTAAENGDTPLHDALFRGDLPDDFVRWLFAQGASLEKKNSENLTPLDVLQSRQARTFDAEWLYPKVRRKDAITIFDAKSIIRTTEPVVLPRSEQAAPPAFGLFFWQATMEALSTYNSRNYGYGVGGPTEIPMVLHSPVDVFVYRAAEGGPFKEIAKVTIDLDTPPKPESWPALQWGDVVDYSWPIKPRRFLDSATLRAWLEQDPETKKALPAPETAAPDEGNPQPSPRPNRSTPPRPQTRPTPNLRR